MLGSNPFVSRGGIKLQAAIRNFKLEIRNCVALDIGSSTGGFVDCLLQNGAKKVYAVDTAYGELAWKLRNDPRVVVMERTNALYLNELPEFEAKIDDENKWLRGQVWEQKEIKVDLITIDAGWTKLELVLPVVKKFLKPGGKIVALLKPHYELLNKRGNLVRGVVPEDKVKKVKVETVKKIKDLGFKIEKQMKSPILGGAGNVEYLLLLSVFGLCR